VGAAPVLCRGPLRGCDHGPFPRCELPTAPGRGRPVPSGPDFRAVIESDDGATILVEWHGYGRGYPAGRRQIVGCAFHLSDNDRYRRLNDTVCVCAGEVRASEDLNQDSSDLVIDVAELIWEPIAE
jgi:hypothetical protein